MNNKKIIGLFLTIGMTINTIAQYTGVVYAENSGISIKSIAGADYVTIAKTGKDYAYVRGSIEQIKAPYMKDGKLYMSLRDLAEIVDAPVKWNQYTKKATVYYLQYEFEVNDGNNTLLKKLQYDNSVEEIVMPGQAEIINGTIYIPAESFIKASDLPYNINGEYITFGREKFINDEMTAALADYSGLFSEEFQQDKIMKIFYIDPDVGRDEGMGTSDDPFMTITGAKLYIRKFKEKNKMDGNIIVYLRGGIYSEASSIVFGPEDSGENGYHIKYVAYPGETPYITGGKKITDWKLHDAEKNIYASYLGEGIRFKYMSEDNKQSIPARTPNEGWLHAVAATSGANKLDFFVAESDIPKMSDPTNARIFMWPGGTSGETMWFSDSYGIADFNAETGAIKLRSEADRQIGTGSVYYFENSYEFLDKPGEFFSSSDGWAYYIPMSEDISNSNILYATGSDAIMVKGTASENVSGLEFSGLDISTTERDKDGISITYGRDIVIDDCYIHETGGDGVYLADCVDITVTDSKFQNIGRSGIVLTSGNAGTEYLKGGYNRVENNIIDTVGACGDAAGIEVNRVDFNYVGHNTISKSPRFGIQVYGQKPTIRDEGKIPYEEWSNYVSGRYNVIDSNDIGYAMNSSQDGGGIYGWGTGDGNVLKRNHLYGISISVSFGYGIYLDDGWDKCWIYDNIVANNQTEKTEGIFTSAFFLKGRYHRVYNNLAYNNEHYDSEDRNTQAFATLPMAKLENDQIYLQKNVFYNSGDYINSIPANGNANFVNEPETRMTVQDYNMFYNDHEKYNVSVAAKGVDTLDDWLMWQNNKYDQNSTFRINPQLVNPENGDLRFMYDSAAYGLGIKDIDFSEIGLSGYNRYADTSKPIKDVHIKNAVTGENSNTRMKVGEKVVLEVSAKTEKLAVIDMSRVAVSFTSDNTSVATVDNSGNVSAIGNGVAKITVKAEYNDVAVTKDYWIIVSDEIESIEFIVPDATYLTGTQRDTFIKAKTKDERHFVPENVTYSSSDTSVAEIDENGKIKFNKAGKAKITATVLYEGKTVSESKDVLVRDALFDKTKVTVPKKMVKVGEKVPVDIRAWDSDGNDFNLQDINVTFNELEGMDAITENGETTVVFNKEGTYAVKVSCVADSVKTTETIQMIVVNDDTHDNNWKVSSYGEGTASEVTVTERGEFEFETNGVNLWGIADTGTIAYREVTLDAENPKAEVIAEFHAWPGVNWDDGSRAQAQVGVVMREKDTAGAKNVTYRWGEGDASPFTWRTEENGKYSYSGTTTVKQDHVWFRLVREGNSFTAYIKLNEEDEWTPAGNCKVEMGNEILIGITGYSTSNEKRSGAVGKVIINTGDDVGKDISSGITYDVSEELKNYKPLTEKKDIKVVYMGGSHVGSSSAMLPNAKFGGRITAFLKQAFPGKNVTGVNAGVGGTGSNYGLLRLENDVIKHNPDIVMIEFSDNDANYDQTEVKKQMEGIVRKLLEMEEPPMIFFVYVPRYEKDKKNARDAHTAVANHYGIPIINCHEYIWDTYWGGNPDDEEKAKFFQTDKSHYTDYGYDAQCKYITECLNNPEKYLKYAKTGASPLTGYYDISGKYVNASEVKKITGWSEGGGTLITSTKAGDTATFEFEGSVFAIKGRLGKTYGKFSIQIDGGTAKTVNSYYASSGGSKVILYSNFNLKEGKHIVTITNLEGKNTIDEFIVNAD